MAPPPPPIKRRWSRSSRHLTCSFFLPICLSPNPSAMNNFHARCTLITFPFKRNYRRAIWVINLAKYPVSGFHCWQTSSLNPPQCSMLERAIFQKLPLLTCAKSFLQPCRSSRRFPRLCALPPPPPLSFYGAGKQPRNIVYGAFKDKAEMFLKHSAGLQELAGGP